MVVYCVCYAAGYLAARLGQPYLSGASLMLAAVYLYCREYRRTGNILHLRGLFSAFWVGGQGVACLQLSNLQTDWAGMTWFCFFLAFAGFWCSFGLAGGSANGAVTGGRRRGEKVNSGKWRVEGETASAGTRLWLEDAVAVPGWRGGRKAAVLAGTRLGLEDAGAVPEWRGGREAASADRRPRGGKGFVRPLFYSIVAVTAVSLASFLFEAVYLGFVPLFLRGVPHAYSTFHVTGVHYFTVSCVLVPSMAVLFFLQGGSRRPWRNAAVVGMAAVCLAIPILCVSRLQLIFAVATALFTGIAYTRRLRLRTILVLVAVMLPLYVLLTIARSHDVAYLNGIFEMKNPATPIFISQPYIYIANNYENFNCLVEALPAHTYGLKMLFPLWTLTGLKFFFPYLVSFPIYIDKEELTTLTLFYDAYYDFGAAGVALFSCALGAAAAWLDRRLERMRNPIGFLFYAQFAFYLALSFFTTWFSNPTTWFYFAVTGLAALYCYRSG